MNEWNDPDAPPEESEYGEHSPYYLVKLKGYSPTLAMRMEGGRWIRIPD